jgi:hypothetical protein
MQQSLFLSLIILVLLPLLPPKVQADWRTNLTVSQVYTLNATQYTTYSVVDFIPTSSGFCFCMLTQVKFHTERDGVYDNADPQGTTCSFLCVYQESFEFTAPLSGVVLPTISNATIDAVEVPVTIAAIVFSLSILFYIMW